MSPRSILALSGAVILALAAAFHQFRGEPARAHERNRSEPLPFDLPEPVQHERLPSAEHAPRAPSTSPTALASASAAAPPAAPGEALLMAKLRELRGSDPALTLQLARDGNARFGDSPDAAERSWFVVKSLTDLGLHDEARLEGRALVRDYPGTSWAEDVYRHLFVNPATHPFERGYGKEYELD